MKPALEENNDEISSLSTKITVIVFWGLVIIGLSFAALILHHVQEDTLESREIIADSIAYNISEISNIHGLDKQILKKKLQKIIEPYNNVKIELSQNKKLINYAENRFISELEDKLTRSTHNNAHPFTVDIIFPNFEETIQDKRKIFLIGLGILLLVFGVILKLLLERILNMPISKMVETAKAISENKLDRTFDEKHSDEFGYLARFINQAIDHMRHHERESLAAKEFAEVTLRSIGDGVITTDKNTNIIFMNPVAEKISGHLAEKAISKPLSDIMPLVDEEDGKPVPHPIHTCLANNITLEVDSNCALINNDGTQIPISISVSPIYDNNNQVRGAVMVFHDVSEARNLQKELSYLASHDHLTGLYNRREFDRDLKNSLMHAKRDSHEHTLCYLDLDQFKVVNDTCGHAAGDLLLKKLSNHLRKSLRKSDVFARLGGDEFALLLLHCPISKAMDVAENMKKLINDFIFVWEGKSFHLGVSIGLAPISPSANDAAEILAAADMACYAAKEDGRNRIHVYQVDDESLHQRRDEMTMVSAVREALKDNRFELFAQPIVPTNNKNEYEHFEVLIRMRDIDGEFILPFRFLPAAERYQLMSTLDRWVVTTAISYIQQFSEKNFSLAVNLSGQSINEDAFLEFVINEINKSGIDASRICFEITETAAVNNLDHAVSFIEMLKRYGCKFALDDFGTGVSSFEYLKKLPVDYLKIDGTFVKQMDQNKVDQAMVQAINEVAIVMGMKTIAEFVENEEIFKLLENIGVNYGQGYWISKPEPINEIIN